MSPNRSLRLCAALLAWAGLAAAQDPGPVYEAPYVPSPMSTVDEMLRLAEVGPEDVVYDLGAGDGRVVIAAAAKFGARGVGVEIDGELVAMARAAAARAGVTDRVRFLQQDLFKTDLREATVVALYLAPNFNLQLRPALLALPPGTRIVSHSSGMGDWHPDRQTAIRKDVLLWIVPASVAGRWSARIGEGPGARLLELEFAQRYQGVSASAVLDGAPTHVWEAKLQGDRLSFVLVEGHGTEREAGLYFEGRVAGRVMEGTVTRGVGDMREALPWRAGR
ncbi:MAG: cyclopropane-fatty-acyl-phospholipid synthase family protein [Burkholderiales bacterium]